MRVQLAGALALAVALAAGLVALLVATLRRRRDAGASVGREIVEVARLTRAGATRETGRLLAQQLGTPLTSMLNNLAAARRLLLRDPPALDEIEAALAEARSAGEGMARAIHRLRTTAPGGIGGEELVDLNDVVRQGMRLVAGRHGVRVGAELSAVPLLRADRTELLEVVVALLLDAVEQVSARGRGAVVMRTRSERGAIELTVEHPGVAALGQDHAYALPPFAAAARLGGGVEIARSIVESYGGTLAGELSRKVRFAGDGVATLRVRLERGPDRG